MDHGVAVHARVGEADRGGGGAGASKTKSAKKERKPRGGDGGWVVFEKEEARRVARD